MFEIHNLSLGVSTSAICEGLNLTTYEALKKMCQRGAIKKLRRSCLNTSSLIEFYSLPEDWREELVSRYGDPKVVVQDNIFRSHIRPDAEAIEYFINFTLPDGRNLPLERQMEYRANAELLRAAISFSKGIKANKTKLGSGSAQKNLWKQISKLISRISKKEYPHSLPKNPRSLQRKAKELEQDGLITLVHKNYCNDNSKKVTESIESLILSLYALPNKPYSSTVHELYHSFIKGEIEVVDVTTGELFERVDFLNKDGEPITFTEATAWNYINDPKNRPLVDKRRLSKLEFNNVHRPHHQRHAPQYSFSKISMDDRDLPRKMKNGKRVKAYYAYDVTSGCVIGASYSHTKDASLFIDCMRDMFRNLDKWGVGMPMEVEVEHHLVSLYKDDLMAAGAVFPFVRWANAGNPQEKRAEHFNRAKKYGHEKKYQEGIGRFYSKLEANRTVHEKVSSSDNETWKEKTYDFEELVADDLAVIQKYNNSNHRNNTLYPDMTKMEVLHAQVNPNMGNLNKGTLARFIGEHTITSVRRNQYVRVQYRNFEIRIDDVLSRLQTNNYQVDAYWLPDDELTEVYLYQGNTYLGVAKFIETYNESTAESTDRDKELYAQQAAQVAHFDKLIRTESTKVHKLEILHRDLNREHPEDDYRLLEPEVPKKTKPVIDYEELAKRQL